MIIPSVIFLARLIKGYNKEFQILKMAKNAGDSCIKMRDDIEITPEDANKLVDFAPEVINNILDYVGNVNHKMLFAMYTMYISIRLKWASVRIINNDKCVNFSLNCDSDNAKNTKFIFNRRKASSSFGMQPVANLPSKFLNTLYEYLEVNN